MILVLNYDEILKVTGGISSYQEDSTGSVMPPLKSTSKFPSPTVPPTSAFVTNSTNIDPDDIYRISLYGVLALLFTILFVVILVRKIKNTLWNLSQSSEPNNYESVASEDNLNPQDNLAFEHHVNGDALNVHRILNRLDSEYDYYSDEDNTDHSKDKPPPYEGPPPYSSVSYEE